MDTTVKQTLKNGLAATVRTLLVFVGAWLVKKNVITDDQKDAFISQGTEVLIGVVLTLGSLAWSWWQKIHANKKTDLALSMPAGTSRATLEQAADKSGV